MARWELLLLSPPGLAVEAFLDSRDAAQLALASRLLRASGRLPRQRPAASVRAFPLAEAREWTAAKVHATLSREYYAWRGRRKPNQRHGRLALAQLTVLMDQILLVSSGIRTSCLVDHCLVQPDLAAFLLETLDRLDVLRSHEDVAALFFGGNAFFVNVPLFIQGKALDLASDLRDLLLVNASASQATPTLAPTAARADSSGDEIDLQLHNAMAPVESVVLALCNELLGARCDEPPRRVIQWVPSSSDLSRTAIAGLILCYPVVYDVPDVSEPRHVDGYSSREEDESSSADWLVQENCLAMCPLVVIHTSLSVLEEPELPLQEFSVPQHLLQLRGPARAPFSRRPRSLLPVLKATCRRRMERALQASSFGFAASTMRLQLGVDERTLPRVAL